MRTLELVQLALVVLAVAIPVALGKRLRRGRMAVLLVGSMVAQLVFEGYRWQLLPLEIATLLLAAGDALWEDRRFRGFVRLRRGVLGAVGLTLAAFPAFVLPVPQLPEPTGAFSVGTATFVIVDDTREEVYGLPEPDPEAEQPPAPEGDDREVAAPPRRIVVQVWYPAQPSEDATPLPWNPDLDVVGPALSERLGFPGFFLSHTGDVLSSSLPGAVPLEGEFPLVLSSHGWSGFRTINLNQIESLASQGFVVVAPDHTHGSIAVRFPDDGTVVYLDERALPSNEQAPEETGEAAEQTTGQEPAEDAVDDEAYQEAAELLVETFAGDLGVIIDRLEEGTASTFGVIADHVDLDHIGVFGHSTGGGAAARLCLEDDRCDAVLGMDAWVEPIPDGIVAREFQVPSLFIRSEEWVGTPNDRRLRGLAERSPSLSYWLGIAGAGHNDFVMTPLFSPIADRIGLKGPIDSERVVPIIDSYLVAFFDRYLLGLGGSALDAPPPPEVELELIP
jgi:pimeloyl-ACP methyl ester carboxylesterase